MSAYRPRKDKFGGLPHISFIMRKPKPLGTEFKCIVDAETGVMKHLEIQEGKDAMRAKPSTKELGACTSTTLRMAMKSTDEGNIVIGDSWFGSVKVRTVALHCFAYDTPPFLLSSHCCCRLLWHWGSRIWPLSGP